MISCFLARVKCQSITEDEFGAEIVQREERKKESHCALNSVLLVPMFLNKEINEEFRFVKQSQRQSSASKHSWIQMVPRHYRQFIIRS